MWGQRQNDAEGRDTHTHTFTAIEGRRARGGSAERDWGVEFTSSTDMLPETVTHSMLRPGILSCGSLCCVYYTCECMLSTNTPVVASFLFMERSFNSSIIDKMTQYHIWTTEMAASTPLWTSRNKKPLWTPLINHKTDKLSIPWQPDHRQMCSSPSIIAPSPWSCTGWRSIPCLFQRVAVCVLQDWKDRRRSVWLGT